MNAGAPRYIRRALNTRPAAQTGALTRALENRGIAVLEFPTLSICTTDTAASLQKKLPENGWLVFTSANGVAALHGCTLSPELRIAVIGEQTANAVLGLKRTADFIATQPHSEGFASEFSQYLLSLGATQKSSIVLLRGTTASKILPESLKAHGFTVADIVVYESVLPAVAEDITVAALAFLGIAELMPEEQGPKAVIFLTSSEAVRNLFRLFAGQTTVPRNVWLPQVIGIPAIVVGPKTAETAREEGFQAVYTAQKPDTDSLVAILDHIPLRT